MGTIECIFPQITDVAELVGINSGEHYEGVEDENHPAWLHYPIPAVREKLQQTMNN